MTGFSRTMSVALFHASTRSPFKRDKAELIDFYVVHDVFPILQYFSHGLEHLLDSDTIDTERVLTFSWIAADTFSRTWRMEANHPRRVDRRSIHLWRIKCKYRDHRAAGSSRDMSTSRIKAYQHIHLPEQVDQLQK